MSLDDTVSVDLKGREDGLSLNFDIEGYACDHSSVWDGDYFNMNMTCDFDGERTVDQRFSFQEVNSFTELPSGTISTYCGFDKALLIPLSPSECPQDSDISNCEQVSFGELCEGDDECGTNPALDNCGGGYDVYRKEYPETVYSIEMAVADDRENSIGGTIRITEDGDKAEMSMSLKVDPTDVGFSGSSLVDQTANVQWNSERSDQMSMTATGDVDIRASADWNDGIDLTMSLDDTVSVDLKGHEDGLNMNVFTSDIDMQGSADWSDGLDLSMSLDDTASVDLKGREDGLSLNFDIEGYACDHSSVWDGDYFNMNMTCDFDGERTVDQRFSFQEVNSFTELPSGTISTYCGFGKALLIPISPSECPQDSDISNCEQVFGELCEGDNECGTNPDLDNCGGYDVYRKEYPETVYSIEMAVADDRENSIGGTIRITEDGDKAEMSMTLKVDPTDVGLSGSSLVEQTANMQWNSERSDQMSMTATGDVDIRASADWNDGIDLTMSLDDTVSVDLKGHEDGLNMNLFTSDIDMQGSADWSDGLDLSMSLDDTASVDLKGREDGLSLNFDIEGYACDHSSVWDGDYFNMNMTCDFDGERTVDQRFSFQEVNSFTELPNGTISTYCGFDKALLIPISPSECPQDSDILNCEQVSFGELCEGDNECGTTNALDNCEGDTMFIVKSTQKQSTALKWQ